MAETLGEFLRRHRKRVKPALSQSTAGESVGVSRQLVTLWESDKSTPDANQLTAMLRLYDVPEGEWAAALKACEA